jgi:RND family efflux transporter MFP subunit
MKTHRMLTRVLPLSLAVAAALAGSGALALKVKASAAAKPAQVARPALTVNVEQPQPVELPSRLSANGTVAAWQEAIVGAETNGLRIATVHVNVGDAVRKGDVLATFAPDTVAAELAQIKAGVAEAEALAAEAAVNAERARMLAASGALSEQQINQYLTSEQTAQARLGAQRAAAKVHQLRLAQTQVIAPDDGVISSRTATQGAVVPAGTELFRLIRGGRLEWRAEVTSSELSQMKIGSGVMLTGADGAQVHGKVRMVAPTVDAKTRYGLVYVDLPKAQSIKAGMFASGEFEFGHSKGLTVAQQSIVIRDGFSYVFRAGSDGKVTQMKVKTGRRHGDRVEVLEGIAPDSTIVTGGAGFLNDGDLVRVAS